MRQPPLATGPLPFPTPGSARPPQEDDPPRSARRGAISPLPGPRETPWPASAAGRPGGSPADGRDPFETITGRSPALRAVLEKARLLLQHDVSVLILGETGTGKELLARALHGGGRRAGRPFIAVNCTAVPGDLLESELFGHVRGAFTGAAADRRGLLEEADGGTFFLDEVGDLGAGLQAKLLRVIQEKAVRRVGENRSRPIDFRLIAATNRDLREEVARGRFRLDLFFRIGVVELLLPPLRERREDIPLLAESFCRRLAAGAGSGLEAMEPQAMLALLAYSWPGNVRELENAIHYALVMRASPRVLRAADLPPAVRWPELAAARPGEDLCSGGLPLRRAREEFDRRYLRSALRRHGGNRSRAATAMGVSRQALLKMIKRLRLFAERGEGLAPGAEEEREGEQILASG